MFTMYFFIIFVLILYVTILLLCKFNWEHQEVFNPTGQKIPIKLSVVIAFRNESLTLPLCIRSIEKQQFPAEDFEVILVDDHSDDGSAEYAADYCTRNNGYRFCRTGFGEKGKKAALIRGIEAASHDVIVLTDADCIAGDKWLENIAEFYVRHTPEMIIGLVDIMPGNGFLAAFQEMEFLSLTGIGAGAAAMGRPLYCSGANLIFTKSRFKEYSDPFQIGISSGDDTLLMHQIKKSFRDRIMILKSPSAIITTQAEKSFTKFLNQRFRWTSKSIHYRDAEIIIMALIVIFINLAMLASVVFFIAGLNFWLFPAVFVAKTLADYSFMSGFIRFMGKNLSVARFVVYELIYMAYIIPSAFTGLFFRFSWKGRKV